MKSWIFIAICLILNACYDKNSNSRSYVISQSHSELEIQEDVIDPSLSLWDQTD